MKKLLIITGIIALSLSLFAEEKSLCEVFKDLTNNHADFSPLIGAAADTLDYRFYSTVEIDQAKESRFKKLFGTEFVASFGDFNSEAEARQFLSGLQRGFMNCLPGFRFAEKIDTFLDNVDFYFVQSNESMFRAYEAHFEISNYGNSSSLSFVYPQTEDNFLTGYSPAFTDYQLIRNVSEDLSVFSFSLKLVLLESFEGFERLKGDLILDPNNYFDRYEAKFMPDGMENCYIEDRGLGIVFYTVPVLTKLEEATFTELLKKYAQEIYDALGTDYGLAASEDGTSITFVHKDNPANRAGMLYMTEEDGLFSLTLILDAYR